MQVGRWSGSAIAVAFVLSSAAARADEPPPPPSARAVEAPTPAVKAPTSTVASSSTPDKEQPSPARRNLPKRVRDTTVLKPDVLPAKTGEAAPAGYHEEEWIRTGTVVTGALVFGIPYLLSMGVGVGSATARNNHSGVLVFPIVGPFILTGFLNVGGGEFGGIASLGADGALFIDGIMQVGGVAALMAGLLAKRRVFVNNEVAKSFVMPMPMRFGANSAGVGVVGTF